MSNRIFYRLVWIPSLAAILVMTVLFARHSGAYSATGPLVSYTSADKSITLLHPSNWKPISTGSQGIRADLTFLADIRTKFEIATDLQGSLQADMLRSSNTSMSQLSDVLRSQPNAPQIPTPTTKSPIETLHEGTLQRDRMVSAGLETGMTSKRQISGEEALETTFTIPGNALFGGPALEGKIITLLLSDRRVTIRYQYVVDNRTTLQPIFEKMLDSLQIRASG